MPFILSKVLANAISDGESLARYVLPLRRGHGLPLRWRDCNAY